MTPEIRNPAIARRRAQAVESAVVSRVRMQSVPCSKMLAGTLRCPRVAVFYLRVRNVDYAYCWGCLTMALDEKLLAPESEYLDAEAKAFEHAAREARILAHAGCSGYSRCDRDGLCHSAVVMTCSSTTHRGNPHRCARHAVACVKKHPDKTAMVSP